MSEEQPRGLLKSKTDNQALDFKQSHALVIGINEYENGNSRLNTAVNDATRLADILQTTHQYQVQLLTNPSLQELTEQLQALAEKIQEGDRLLFYFAGHGIAQDALENESGPAGYIVPRDADINDITTCFPMQALHDVLSELSCKHVLVILDCCFAGAFQWVSTRDSIFPSTIYRERFERYIRDPAWQVLTSTAHDQAALDSLGNQLIGAREEQSQHSPFALALFNGLLGEADVIPRAKEGKPAGDGLITATELYLYLRDEIEAKTESKHNRQTPRLLPLKKHDKGEFVFIVPDKELDLPPAPELNNENNPYLGLSAYSEENKDLFFGRQTVIDKLVEQVQQHQFNLVVGVSGAGKSSLVNAGLTPVLRENDWFIISPLRLTENPLECFISHLNHHLELELQDLTSITFLLKKLQIWQQNHLQQKIFLIIDQFEELITISQESQRKAFIALLNSILLTEIKLHIVVTLRSDFEPQITELFNKSALYQRILVPSMTQDELRQVIERPANERVLYFNPPQLIDQLINEVVQMPGALPLLSFTLSELYIRYIERRGDDRALTQEDYEGLGRVIGSLQNRANQEYERLGKEHQATMRRMMLRMITTENGEWTRRRVFLDELIYHDDKENQRVHKIKNQLIDARLLVTGETDGQVWIEPAHDALIKAWSELQKWREQQEKQLPFVIHTDLIRSAKSWQQEKFKRNKNDLLWNKHPSLETIKAAKKMGVVFNQREDEFITKSISKRKFNRIRNIVFISVALITLTLTSIIFYAQAQNAKNLAFQNAVDGATAAQDRGNWQAAKNLYSNAIEQVKPQSISELLQNINDAVQTLRNPIDKDKVRLEIENLRAYFILGDREQIKAELEKFSQRTDLGQYEATYWLLHGDFLISNPET
ncbi:MAG: caspase family protein, partial [Thiotrichaceae bacterium]|nr:caspase family protein [Thiotrichaceae bacterium]